MATPGPYHDLHFESFVHQSDLAAQKALRNVPGMDSLLKAVSKLTVERSFAAMHSHHCIEISTAQYPSLWKFVERAAEVLDVPPPRAYLQTNYDVNAYAFGFTEYTITLYSGLVDLFDDDEIQVIVAHELGHIVCEHMLYKSVAVMLETIGTAALHRFLGPSAGLAEASLMLAMLAWSRAAELSCDRAALLVVDDRQLVATTLAKLAGGTTRFAHELDLDALQAQDQRFESEAGTMDRLFDAQIRATLTHPDPIRRVREIVGWAASPDYERIKGGDYVRRNDPRFLNAGLRIEGLTYCPTCAKPVEDAEVCPHCAVNLSADRQRSCPRGHVNNLDWKFCRTCGEALDSGD